jgi:hypothetical protein
MWELEELKSNSHILRVFFTYRGHSIHTYLVTLHHLFRPNKNSCQHKYWDNSLLQYFHRHLLAQLVYHQWMNNIHVLLQLENNPKYNCNICLQLQSSLRHISLEWKLFYCYKCLYRLVHGLQIDLDESIGHVEPNNLVNMKGICRNFDKNLLKMCEIANFYYIKFAVSPPKIGFFSIFFCQIAERSGA